MLFKISQAPIETIDDCLKKDLLAFVTYGGIGVKRCFSYPQYCFDRNVISTLSQSVFPERGHLPMAISSDADGYALSERYGEVVIMNVNYSDLNDNFAYGNGTSGTSQDVFNGVINPNYAKGKSQIEFTRFSTHPLSTRLVQVVNLTEPLNFDAPIEQVIYVQADEAQPMTKLALVAQAKGGRKFYFGPFECNASKDGGYRLSASSDYGAVVAAIDESAFTSTVELLNENEMIYATFVDAQEVKELFASAAEKHDWMKDAELIEAIGRLAKLDTVGLGKNDGRALKDAIKACSEAEAKIELSDSRRERMEDLLESLLSWRELVAEDKKDVIASADPKELAQFVLDDPNFQTFFDKVMNDDRIRKQVEERRSRLTEETERLEAARDEAKEKADEVKQELSELEAKRDELKANLQKEVDEQTSQARAERDNLAEEARRLKEEITSLDDRRAIIEDQVRRTVRNMTDETAVREKILENSMLQQIVSALNEPDKEPESPEEPKESKPSIPILRLEEGKRKGERLLDTIAERLADAAGREFQLNDVANLAICVTQGYITTLSGLPGTGKTSLANAFGAALGLKNPQSPRFAQVAVERGWTSYKELVGYFNPLTNTMVKSCPELFDMLMEADEEQREGKLELPWLILLDEANLSSLEHYWSPFLGMCDRFTQDPVSLSLGTDEPLLVPSTARFLATVNFDHTTEELSPRFLDRSWVISLNPTELDVDAAGEQPSPQLDLPAIPMDDMKEVFGPHKASTISEDNRSRLREVVDICARHHTPVSPRSQRMMVNYISAAQKVLNTSSADASYAPVDYAISQKVIPTLSGPEDTLRGLIDELMGVGGLPMTRKHLERMSKAGEDSGFVQFFA